MDGSDTVHLAVNEGCEQETGHLISFAEHSLVSVLKLK